MQTTAWTLGMESNLQRHRAVSLLRTAFLNVAHDALMVFAMVSSEDIQSLFTDIATDHCNTGLHADCLVRCINQNSSRGFRVDLR